MKRALAIAVALCTLGIAGFSQISGSWKGEYCLPAGTLSTTLTLNYEVAGFTVGSISTFTASGYSSQQFTLKGTFGPFSVTGNMYFDPVAVAYTKADLTTGFDFGGIALTLKVEHTTQTTSYCPTQTPNLRYTLTGTLAPITAKLIFIDCCTGTAFYNLNVTLKGLSLCCGIVYNIEFDFLKTGFNYVKFTGINIPLCCGVSFDVGITFTTDTKTVTVNPKFAGLGDACLTIYAGPFPTTGSSWDGIELYGWKIKCTLGDCNYIEFVTALNVTQVEKVLGDIFLGACEEYEYLGLGFCGAGCCGGKYTVNIKVFFGTLGGLFDVTRLGGEASLPIMGNLSLNISGYVGAAACATSSVCVGWTFTF